MVDVYGQLYYNSSGVGKYVKRDKTKEILMHMELRTERLLLRPLNVLDLWTVYEYASDIENTKYMIYFPHKSIEETRHFLECISAEWQKEETSFMNLLFFMILYTSERCSYI